MSGLRANHRRAALLRGVSVSALLVAGAAATPARAGSLKTLTQALASHPSAAVVAAANGGGAAAAAQAGLGAQNFANAAARFRTLSEALAGGAYAGAPVPNGVGAGGLQQAPGVAGSNNSTLWSGAATSLAQSSAGGTTTVTVDQTSAVAALTWKSFNVGAHTKLVFNQSAGGSLASSWVAINSVQDPNANPATILGEISAPGKVYILDPNGVLFGAGAQVNVGGLIATTANIAQAQFTTATNGQINGFSLYGTLTNGAFTPTFQNAPNGADVVVAPGAAISTPVPSGTNGGGYVMLLAATVQNQGVISTPQGQTVLAAGNNIILQPGFSTANPIATVVGSQVAVTNAGSITGTGTAALGAATNSGIIIADQGDISMVGHLVTQAGVLLATTTVDNRGTVHLLTDNADPTASVVLAPGSITEVLPEDLYSLNGTLVTALENPNAAQGTLQTALDAQRAANLTQSATDNALRDSTQSPQLNDFNNLADTLGESRIEISTGGTVTLQNGALALAQGGQVAVNAAQQISLQSGATIDVSGTNAVLPASDNSLYVQGIVPYYLRDSGANRTGGLEFQNVYIDERTLVEISSGAYAGNIYTAGGLLEVSGNLGLIGHGIQEWSAIGGQVTLQSVSTTAGVSTGGTVLVSSGATINLTGGTVTYSAGMVKQSYVVSADGRVFNINDAPGDLAYVGVYDGVQETQARWHITQTFINPLLTPSEIFESAYTVGRDAGNLTVSAATALLDGTVAAGVTVGPSQISARPANVSDPFLLAQSVVPLAGNFAVGAYSGGQLLLTQFDSTVALGGGSNDGTPSLRPPSDVLSGTISIDTTALNAAGFANISILTGGDLSVSGALTLADGGTVTLAGGTVELDAGITAHAGQVNLTNLLTIPGSNGGTTTVTPLSSGSGGITVAAGVVIDTSGEWTNLATDPTNVTLEGFANGGAVNIISTGGVDLAGGSVVDVSSGGKLSSLGKLTAASGGNITISADIVPGSLTSYLPAGDVTLDGGFDGLASGAGGTLSITVPQIVLGSLVNGYPNQLVPLNKNAVLALPDNSLFSSGFSDYVLNGYFGVEVDPGRTVAVTRPVYVLQDYGVRTGAPAAAAYQVLLAPLYTAKAGADTITQRAGASIALESTIDPGFYAGGGGVVFIDPGASVTVDPRQSITVAAYGQITDLGTLTAHGGTITLANTRYDQTVSPDSSGVQSNYTAGLSVWIGQGALVDASGQAVVFTDSLGRLYGESGAGGTILLGGLGGTIADSPESTYAQVIERPGAVLDAQGASAAVNIVATAPSGSPATFAAPVTLAGNGGTILARSYSGIAFDGTLLAGGAGAGAAGGTLTMRIDPLSVTRLLGLPASFQDGARILVSQAAVAVQPLAGLLPGETTDPTTTLLGRISQAQLTAGGFDSLNLFAADYIAFDGNVALHLARAVTLETAILGNTSNVGTVSVTAPYISLLGKNNNDFLATNGGPLLLPGRAAGSLTLDADLIDIGGSLTLGGAQAVANGDTPSYLTFGYDKADFVSAGDLRFDATAGGLQTVLASSGNVTLQAAQLYPATGANAVVYAGENIDRASNSTTSAYQSGTLTILGQNGPAPAAPFSVGGTLALISDVVVQDGVVRAPEGVIQLGADPIAADLDQITDLVSLGANSITSVSLYGQTIPYGGTVDGVNYSYAGSAVGTFSPTVIIGAAQFTAAAGSSIDLRGGGTLAGAGFIPGRGGSADVNLTPLLNSGTGTVAANTSDPVFAIVAGYGSEYAPVSPGDAGYSTPGVGEQITITAGEVAGLAAGTYTLLPAYYDLLPGGYRVELTGSAMAQGATQPFGNFTTMAAVTVGYANTSIAASVPQAALITAGAGVRQLSQYDEETYNTFEANSAQTFGAPRPDLPQDAKTLQILLTNPSANASGAFPTVAAPIAVDAASLLKAPATFTQNGTLAVGYGATVEVAGQLPIEVLGAGDGFVSVPFPLAEIGAAALDALTAPVTVGLPGGTAAEIGTRLVLGGTLTTNQGTISIVGETPELGVLGGADLTAADLILTAASNGGTVLVDAGATVSGLGQGLVVAGAQTQYLFTTGLPGSSSPALTVSNNDVQFLPSLYNATAALIDVGQGATLAAATGGSLNFVAPQGTNVEVAPANLAASFVNLQVSNINIGSAATLAEFADVLPGGLTLTDAALSNLAQNATVLSLTAAQAVNLLGNVTLDSGSTDLVLYTPAIYGYGVTTGGVTAEGVTIKAPAFTWGGVAAADPLQDGNTTAVSAVPGGYLAGSVTTAGGTATLGADGALTVDAAKIVFGYGPETQANDQVQLDRVAVGFANVTFAASQEITGNNQGSVAVYATPGSDGAAGSGGALNLQTPLLTADSGAVLKFVAGGTLDVTGDGTLAAASTTGISTLGATIDLTGASVSVGSLGQNGGISIGLPSGVLGITADGVLAGSTSTTTTSTGTVTSQGTTTVTTVDGSVTVGTLTGATIALNDGANIDLSGRTVPIFDQDVHSPGGTLTLQSAAGTVTQSSATTLVSTSAGGTTSTTSSTSQTVGTTPDSSLADGNDITVAPGAVVNVAASGAAAGLVAISALDGTVSVGGTLLGASPVLGGSFTLIAGTLGAASSFADLNAMLDAGGFSGLRGFELATGDVTVGATMTIAAHTVDIATDTGNIDILGTIDASGSAPGSIALSAGGVLTLAGTAVLDAQATGTARDSYGNPIDAENRAHVTLSATGSSSSITLSPGATIDVGYPGAGGDPQGQVVINAPRTASGDTLRDVAVSAPGTLDIIGAASIDLFAFRTYTPTDANGTVVQDTSVTNAATSPPIPAGAVGLVQIGQDSTAYMAQIDTDGATLAGGQLAGLAGYGAKFNVAPGVQIVAGPASGGNLTISGDLDFSALRYSDPTQYFGSAVQTSVSNGQTIVTPGSGEAGSIVFRAGNDLTVNGSVSDGFLPPPDSGMSPVAKPDSAGWEIYDNPANLAPWIDPTNADLLLPSSAYGVYKAGGKTKTSGEIVLLGESDASGAATVFDTIRPISLNYAISIESADLKANVVIPFSVTLANPTTGGNIAPVPAGGWVATSSVIRNGVVLFQPGQLIPAGFQFKPGDVLGAGAVLPVSVATVTGQVVPAGTSLDIFADSSVTLANDTAPLPVNALIPSFTQAYFGVEYTSANGAPVVADINTLYLRPSNAAGVQGYLYPLAQMLPAGSQSWNMDFVAGANLNAASADAVQPSAALNGGGLAAAGATINQAPGSLLIDDEHYFSYSANDASFGEYNQAVIAFSVIRTGTGDLSLVAGGNVDQNSLFGIYTAGTQAPLGGGQDAQFDVTRQAFGADGATLPGGPGISAKLANALIADYQAYYPTGGGDVLLAAQGNVTSDIYADPAGTTGSGAVSSDAVGNWLWRQGSGANGEPTAWWINFGTLVDPLLGDGSVDTNAAVPVQMTGFTGFGALGGGNVTVNIGGNAGQISDRDEIPGQGGSSTNGPQVLGGEGLVIAVGATGRDLGGTLVLTGGGNINLTIGGTLNPIDAAAYDTGAQADTNGAAQNSEAQAVNGDLIDVRGNIAVTAGAIGRIDYVYNSGNENLFDPRATDPAMPNDGEPNGGIVVVPGDGSVSIATDRDLVLGGAGDPGREPTQGLPALGTSATGSLAPATGVITGFSLWQADTSISLFSAGGNVTPSGLPNQSNLGTAAIGNANPTEQTAEFPPILLVTAAKGDIIYGQDVTNPATNGGTVASTGFVPNIDYALETAPAADGQVQFLAGRSIIANGYVVDLSGANPATLTSPADPAYQTIDAGNFGTLTNVLAGPEQGLTALSLFALAPDTPTPGWHNTSPDPARFYAADGDIVNFQTGETLNYVLNGSLEATWYVAEKPVWIEASNDIVSTGTRPDAYPASDTALFNLQENEDLAPTITANVYASGDLFLNNTANDVSVISAGRDILSAYAYIIGPGLLEVDAGRNIYQAAYAENFGGGAVQVLSFGAFKSLGNDFVAGATPALSGGAGIAVLAGVGSAGPDYTAFADLYFNPANQANLSVPIADQPGKVQQVYSAQLVAWLAANYGYTGGADGALAYFQNNVPQVDQDIFVRTVFFAELTASGAQESDPNSRFYKSYVRGKSAICTLFSCTSPSVSNPSGVPTGNTGAITAYSGPVLAANHLDITTDANDDPIVDAAGVCTNCATFDGGIATLLGGTVTILDPGGALEFGIPGGPAPGNNSGIITYGAGDVDIYALDSVLLGKSRIFATGGGNISIWSSSGDINAGIGAKTSVSYNPPVLSYDDVGDVTETPPADTSGAGIATLQPLPSVPPGDVSLIAPAGSIDAGEAGVRVSGNLVLAGQRVIGAANITVKGTTQGAPTVNVASLGAVDAAGAAAGATTAAAQSQAERNNQAREAAATLDVEVISVGGSYDDERKRRKQGQGR